MSNERPAIQQLIFCICRRTFKHIDAWLKIYNCVVSFACLEYIRTGTTRESVITSASENQIITGTNGNLIVSFSVYFIISTTAFKKICAISS